MGYNQMQQFIHGKKKAACGFTFIELIMVMAIVAILSVPGAYLMSYLIQNSVFIPNKLNMDMLASDALDIMIEGDPQVKGLRFSQKITDAQNYQVTFVNQDGQTILYQLNTGTNKLYRQILIPGPGPLTLIPYYGGVSGLSITGKNSKLFTYRDANEAVMTTPINPANVRRIEMTLIAKTGSGSYSEWQGQSEQNSSIAVKKFQP